MKILVKLLIGIYLIVPGFVYANDLADILAEGQSIPREIATKQIQNVFAAIGAELEAGREVRVRNFGRFFVKARDSRIGRNPRTGKKIKIPARRYPRFSSSDKLKRAVSK